MKISIIGGTGYVGLVTGAGLAAHGNEVICADIDKKKINDLNNNILPVYEKGLDSLLQQAKQKGRILFTNCIETAVKASEIIILAVGTPQNKFGDTDLAQLIRASKSIAYHLNGYKIIAVKSTVPVGTCQMIELFIKDNLKNDKVSFDIVSNPEFLREGNAVEDFMCPDRIVIGANSNKPAETMKKLYSTFNSPIVLTDIRSSEMIKYACNSYLATRISFINEIANICEKVDADINSVIEGMKYDKRIGGHYLSPGPGFGGPCLTKDLKSLIGFGHKSNANVNMLKAVLKRNEIQINSIIEYVNSQFIGLSNKTIAVLGLSFKAGTNDTRNSPSLQLIKKAIKAKYSVKVYDPVVKEIDEPLNSEVFFAENIEEVSENADCLVIMTEWDEFRHINLELIYKLMKTPIIVDTRNILPASKVKEAGFTYKGIGIRSNNYESISDSMMQII